MILMLIEGVFYFALVFIIEALKDTKWPEFQKICKINWRRKKT